VSRLVTVVTARMIARRMVVVKMEEGGVRPWLTTATRNVGATVKSVPSQAADGGHILLRQIPVAGSSFWVPGWTRNAHQPHANWFTVSVILH
jgi:hypothetical protein